MVNNLSVARLSLGLALLLVCGLFALRGYALLTQSTGNPNASVAEQEVTHLIETVVGSDQVRVSINSYPPKSYLILIDGDRAPITDTVKANIETILSVAQNFDADTETLIVEQYPFATALAANLKPQHAIELLLLALLICLQMLALASRGTETSPPVQLVTQDMRPHTGYAPRPAETKPAGTVPNADISKATQVTQAHPDQAVKLLRSWMNGSEGNA